MSDLRVEIKHVSAKSIHCEIEQDNGEVLKMMRIEWGHEKYRFYIEDEEGNDIDITGIVNKEVKQIFATIYHEQYQLKNQ